MKPTDFAKALSQYLSEYLPGQRNVSPNTIKSYRETFKLFLKYCKSGGLSIERLRLQQIDEPLIVGFLSWLEQDRKSSVATRNQRLACIHGFFRYIQIENPDGILSYQKILSIPMEKAPIPVVNHLTPDALKLILAQPDLLKVNGRRDLTMLSVLYDTGSRVQELADLTVRDVRLDHPPIVTLTGKGRKTRQVPLMSNTESILRQYMTETRLLQNGMQDCPLFLNLAIIAPATAFSISASSNTINGAFPPNSKAKRFIWSAAWRIKLRPTGVDPVKLTTRTAECFIIASVVLDAGP